MTEQTHVERIAAYAAGTRLMKEVNVRNDIYIFDQESKNFRVELLKTVEQFHNSRSPKGRVELVERMARLSKYSQVIECVGYDGIIDSIIAYKSFTETSEGVTFTYWLPVGSGDMVLINGIYWTPTKEHFKWQK